MPGADTGAGTRGQLWLLPSYLPSPVRGHGDEIRIWSRSKLTQSKKIGKTQSPRVGSGWGREETLFHSRTGEGVTDIVISLLGKVPGHGRVF